MATPDKNKNCPGCHKAVKVYSFSVSVLEATRGRNFLMFLCAACSRQLLDYLSLAAGGAETVPFPLKQA